ncbi:DUF975 family protein [Wenyingzhuangia sp. IMCC45467]
MSNIDILKKSFQDLKNGWSIVFLASMPLTLLPNFLVYNKNLGLLLILIFTGVLRLCLSKVVLAVTDGKTVKMHQIFNGFNQFKNALGVFLLSMVFIAIGLLLFIIPGIIILIWLSQSFFILVEHPEIEPLEVFKKSKELMKGYEFYYFLFFIGFISVSLICIWLKLPFLSFLLLPIEYTFFANFYRKISIKY